MFGLSANIDLSFLKSRELLQVCIGANEAILNFDGDISITIETDICYRSAKGDSTRFTDILHAASSLARLINSVVARVWREDPGTLLLEFSGGEIIELHDTSSKYESYQIRHGQRVIVV